MDLATKLKAVKLIKENETHKKKNICLNDFKRNYLLYIMVLPVVAYYLIFCYKPIYGLIIAFKEYTPGKSMLAGQWVGFRHFIDFFTQPYFERTLRNTLTISISSLIFGFPAPIILALMINELKSKAYKKTVQTITYLPHFISLVVIAGIIKDFTSSEGVITEILSWFGGQRISMLSQKEFFVPIYVISEIWQTVGWGSIIYLAALSGIDPQLYEAAIIDGAGRIKQTLHITIPSLVPTIVVLLILRIGNLLSVGFEKIILLQNPTIYDTSDVISSYVYRVGIGEQNWSFSTAVGLFNSVINFFLLIGANFISRKLTDSSLW